MVLLSDPIRLLPTLATMSIDVPWAAVIGARLRSQSATGSWHVDDVNAPSALAHALLPSESGALRVQLASWGVASAALALAVAAVSTHALPGGNVSIAALDRALVDPLSATLSREHGLEQLSLIHI